MDNWLHRYSRYCSHGSTKRLEYWTNHVRGDAMITWSNNSDLMLPVYLSVEVTRTFVPMFLLLWTVVQNRTFCPLHLTSVVIRSSWRSTMVTWLVQGIGEMIQSPSAQRYVWVLMKKQHQWTRDNIELDRKFQRFTWSTLDYLGVAVVSRWLLDECI